MIFPEIDSLLFAPFLKIFKSEFLIQDVRPVLLFVRADKENDKSFYLQIKESLTVPKQEFAYSSKSSNEAQTYQLTLIKVLTGLENKDV